MARLNDLARKIRLNEIDSDMLIEATAIAATVDREWKRTRG